MTESKKFLLNFFTSEAAFGLSMIAPVKKSVNHARTVASMRETGWEKQQEAHLRSDSTV